MTKRHPTLRSANWLLLVATLAGCGLQEPPAHWSDQLVPDGPCWRVNLGDGLDEESTQEFHDLFSCLNRTGNFDALAEIDTTMDATGRDGEPIGLELIGLFNDLPSTELDIFGLLGKIIAFIQERHTDLEVILESIVEVMYGRPYTVVQADVILTRADELDRGLFRPAIPLMAGLATDVLDEGDALPDRMVELLSSDMTDDLLCTAVGIFDSDDPVVSEFSDSFVGSMATVWFEVENDANDLWPDATGHSLRDLAQVAWFDREVDGTNALDAMRPPLSTILNDDDVRVRTRTVLESAHAAGSLRRLPGQLLYLADVDPAGVQRTSSVSEDLSALQAGVRLLERGNTDVTCEVPFIGTEIPLGNLSVAILRTISQMDPDSVNDGVAILSDLLDFSLTQALLRQIAEGGYCPPLDVELLGDLRIIDRFGDPAVDDLIPVLIDLLGAVYDPGNVDHLQETVDLLSEVSRQGVLPPVEELLRDTADSALLQDGFALLPVLLDASALQVDACPTGSQPVDFDAMWALARDVIDDEHLADDPLMPIVESVFENEDVWNLLDNGFRLAQYEDARIHMLPSLLVDLVESDPDGEQRDTLVGILADSANWRPLLAVVEHEDFVEALRRADPEGPLPFAARLITSDTVTVMLQTVRALLDSLGAVEQTDSSG